MKLSRRHSRGGQSAQDKNRLACQGGEGRLLTREGAIRIKELREEMVLLGETGISTVGTC